MGYKIPLFSLNFGKEEVDAAAETIRSNWISTGPKCEEFENQFKQLLQVRFAISLSNCTNALHLACVLGGIKPGDEVLCPSLTFAASVNCIKYVGATPVFCDIESVEQINIDPKEIERKITSRTTAIVVVHMAGFPARMDEIMTIARNHRLLVIEDACHGPLSEYKGKCLGTIGDIGCFSFFSNKNISIGEGGMLVTNNEVFAKRAYHLRSHGMTTMSYQRAAGHATEYDIIDLGYNYRMDDIRASIGIVQLRKLQSDLKKRRLVRETYLEMLSGIDKIIIPFHGNTEYVSNYIFPIVLKNSTAENRNKIRSILLQYGIQTSVHYPAIHRFSIYNSHDIRLPFTEYVSANEITLPMYGSLTTDDISFIVEHFIKAIEL